MKKKLLTICTVLLSSLFLMTSERNMQNHNDLLESTVDLFRQNEEKERISFRKAFAFQSSNVLTSKVYTQVGLNTDETSDYFNYSYLRFATAIRGDVNALRYDATLDSEITSLKGKDVNTLYKGISAEDNIFFASRNDLFDTQLTSTKDYYWAVYTIAFSPDTIYADTNIDVSLIVNGKKDDNLRVSTTLNKEKMIQKSQYSLGKYIEYSSIYNTEIAFESKLIEKALKGSTNDYFSVEGACSDGRYFYYAMSTNGRKNVQIIKYDLETKKIEEKSEEISISEKSFWNESFNMFYENGMIYMIDYANKCIKVFDTNLKVIETKDLTKNISSICSNKATKQHVYCINTTATIVDENGNVETTFELSPDSKADYFADFPLKPTSAALFQGLYGNEEYIYAMYNHDSWCGTEIQVFDWSGKKLKSINIELPKTGLEGTDNDATANVSYNLQNMIEYNGKLYLGALKYSGRGVGLYIFEISYK